jgi:hypothetical protein
MKKDKQEQKIKILEAKVDELARLLKVELYAEVDDEGWVNVGVEKTRRPRWYKI